MRNLIAIFDEKTELCNCFYQSRHDCYDYIDNNHTIMLQEHIKENPQEIFLMDEKTMRSMHDIKFDNFGKEVYNPNTKVIIYFYKNKKWVKIEKNKAYPIFPSKKEEEIYQKSLMNLSHITYVKKGDIFQSKCDVIVIPVNCEGIASNTYMKKVKEQYPDLFHVYKGHCQSKLLQVGKLLLSRVDTEKRILFFPTKNSYRYKSKLEYVELGLQKFLSTYTERRINSIAFPLLGTKEEGLIISIVKQTMEKYLSVCSNITIEIYE